MTNSDNAAVDRGFLANSLASFIQIGALVVMLYWCYAIVSPFLSIIIWSLILSVALYPAHVALRERLGGRDKVSATVLVLLGLAVILVPAGLITESTVDALQELGTSLDEGTARVPPPPDRVAEWPVIGASVYESWGAAAANLDAAIDKYEPQLRQAGRRVLAFTGRTVGSALQFAIAIIIAGVLMTIAPGGHVLARNVMSALVGPERGPDFADLSITTIRSVAKGVLGVAFIQAILSLVGMSVAGVPGAGIWAGIILVLAIVQLPPLVVLGPVAIWYFNVAEPVPATVFLVFAALVSFSDTVLKPLLLGRGVETPMLVILIGAIGGAMTKGVMGLFEGAVILALGYELFMAWVTPAQNEIPPESDDT
jgi:predicted PurR-regulated permease PerM